MPSRRELKRAWQKRHAAEIEAAKTLPLTNLEEIPFSSVVRDGIEFRIHGLLHGQRRLFRLAPHVKEWMRSHIAKMDAPPDEAFVTERGFARLLGFDKGYELDYTAAFVRSMGVGKALGLIAIALTSVVLAPVLLVVMRFSREPETREMRAALRDERHLPRVRLLHTLTNLPPETDFDVRPRSIRVQHSVVMMDALVVRARSSGAKVMHVICGLAHEQDLVYLLGRD